ncbi:MAG: right-handed parallel beta-helix repeat-containing protein [Phycisphaerae bacterium]
MAWRKTSLSTAVGVGLLIASTQGQTMWYVDDDNCPGPGSGTQGDPFCKIQDGIDTAEDTDTVLVSPGTYNELVNFNGKAITLKSTDGSDVTTIHGEGLSGTSVVTCSNGEGPDTVLQGFTITGGEDSGMQNIGSNPTVTRCSFLYSLGYVGGGMHNEESSPTVTDCTFAGNVADWGGGMDNQGESNPIIANCIFAGNVAAFDGGGIDNLDSSPTVANSTFSGNWAADLGGGMQNWWDSYPTVTGCTFSGNVAGNGGGMGNTNGSSPAVTNCILWGNNDDSGDKESAQIYVDGAVPVVTYTLVEGLNTFSGGTGNIDGDPLFARNPDPGSDGQWDGVDDDYGNLHLQAGSPCVDAGDNSAVWGPTDLDGNPRIVMVQTAIVDLGAYEFQEGTPIPTVSEWGMVVMTLLVLTAGTLVRKKVSG